ncbi:MAG: hypothetical protein E6J43_10325 [Chloroflexi bacterium]|nr:MAG: hypothetical protein E6J43_10325 [Chloroflexota bacterium]
MPEPVNSRRRLPYPGTGAIVYVPREIWVQSLEALRLYGRLGSEGLVLWGGTISNGTTQVTGLFVPGHEPQGGHVKMTAAEGRWLVRKLKERDEKLVAQFHSHLGSAGHSPGDDDHAASAHEGFLSLVAARFGRESLWPEHCGVHEYDGVTFRRMTAQEVRERIRIAPLREQLRALPEGLDQPGLMLWLSTIASKLRRRLTG